MHVWMVRHGCAGDKDEWSGDDRERPLDTAGVEQAKGLAELLADQHPSRLTASPTARCVETLEPLARSTGLPVLREALLLPARGVDAVLDLIVHQPDGAVLCTHGEVMKLLLHALAGAGVHRAERSAPDLLRKGVAWRLDLGRRTLSWESPTEVAVCPRHAANGSA